MLCADDPVAAELARTVTPSRTYGWRDDADYRVHDYEGGRTGSRFVLSRDGEELGPIDLPVPGRHNARTPPARPRSPLELGVPFEAIVQM